MGKLAEIISHPEEIWPLVQLYQVARKAKQLPQDETWKWCYGALNRTSRSFALVIQQLPPELKDAVCIFYLVLRALDTVEDDMAIPIKDKVPALKSFHERIGDRGFTMKCGGKPTDVELMEKYPTVADAYLRLDAPMQKVIKDITRRMGAGMAEFIEKEVETVKDWDQYCHYVAGLVGIGLSQLFAASEREGGELAEMEDLANHMGLFLQKTNIIRDYLEDIMEEPAPRMFWPREIWGEYAGELAAFKEPSNIDAALQCLNHMIANALAHVEPCFDYMVRLRDPQIFNFCAIPQVMAMGTLSLCFNNPGVFRGVVKMRRGQTASLVVGMRGMETMYENYADFAGIISARCKGEGTLKNDAVIKMVLAQTQKIQELCAKGLERYERSRLSSQLPREPPVEGPARLGLVFLFGSYFAYAWQLGGVREAFGADAPGDNRLDYMQKLISATLLMLALYVVVTGRRV